MKGLIGVLKGGKVGPRCRTPAVRVVMPFQLMSPACNTLDHPSLHVLAIGPRRCGTLRGKLPRSMHAPASKAKPPKPPHRASHMYMHMYGAGVHLVQSRLDVCWSPVGVRLQDGTLPLPEPSIPVNRCMWQACKDLTRRPLDQSRADTRNIGRVGNYVATLHPSPTSIPSQLFSRSCPRAMDPG